MNVLKICILAGIAASLLNAADFSKSSDKDLIKVAGIVSIEDYADYKLEIIKRMKAKKEKDAKKFRDQLHAQMEKNTENLTLKEWRAYQKATKEALESKIKSLSEQEKKELGFDKDKHAKCDMHKK